MGGAVALRVPRRRGRRQARARPARPLGRRVLARRQHRPGRAPPPRAALPAGFGEPDTASRQFRRWARAGLRTRPLRALADDRAPGAAVPRRLEGWIRRAFRRAWRVFGVAGTALARRLGFLSALRGPSWLLPDPDLSERVFRRVNEEPSRGLRAVAPGFLRAAWRLMGAAGGRRSIPRSLAAP